MIREAIKYSLLTALTFWFMCVALSLVVRYVPAIRIALENSMAIKIQPLLYQYTIWEFLAFWGMQLILSMPIVASFIFVCFVAMYKGE